MYSGDGPRRAHNVHLVSAMSVPGGSDDALPAPTEGHANSHRRAAVSHEVKRHTECCNRTRKIALRTQSLMASVSYANPYATYKLRGCHGSHSRVSDRAEKDYTQTLI